jgi:hypothetical protein
MTVRLRNLLALLLFFGACVQARHVACPERPSGAGPAISAPSAPPSSPGPGGNPSPTPTQANVAENLEEPIVWRVVEDSRKGDWTDIVEIFRRSFVEDGAPAFLHRNIRLVAAAAIGRLHPEDCDAPGEIVDDVPARERVGTALILSWCGRSAVDHIQGVRADAPADEARWLVTALAAADPAAYGDAQRDQIRSLPAELLPGLMLEAAILPMDWALLVQPLAERLRRERSEDISRALILAVKASRGAIIPDPAADATLASSLDLLVGPGDQALAVLADSSSRSIRDALRTRLARWCSEQRSTNQPGFLQWSVELEEPGDRLWSSMVPVPYLRGPGFIGTRGINRITFVCPGSPAEEMGYLPGDDPCVPTRTGLPTVQRGLQLIQLNPTGHWQ